MPQQLQKLSDKYGNLGQAALYGTYAERALIEHYLDMV